MENNEIQNEIPAIYNVDIIALAEGADKRAEAINKIKRASLKVTNPRDWTNQGGKPYLQVSGSEKVARLFGISWRIDSPELFIEEDGHFNYTYKGYFNIGNVEIEAIGTRSSKDEFFSTRYKYIDGEKKKTTLPPSEIDKGDVKKAAYTNCIGNGVTRLLGIRNMSWEDLKDGGISKEQLSGIDYGDKPEMSTESKSQRDEIQKMLSEMFNNDPAKISEALEKITSFTGKDGKTIKGKSKIEDLSEKAISPNYGKVKKLYDEWSAKHGQPSDSQPNN